MNLILMLVMLMILISLILILINFFFSKKSMKDREKKSCYECGFDSFESSRLPYSVHFFLISMIFLIFDIELSILFPLILIYEYLSWMNYLIYIIFMMVFFLGLYMEWMEGSLEWNK